MKIAEPIFYIYQITPLGDKYSFDIGQYDEKYNVFYNQITIETDYFKDEMKRQIQLGKEVKLSEKLIKESLVLKKPIILRPITGSIINQISEDINPTILKVIEAKEKEREIWEKNNPDTWPNYTPPENTDTILRNYFEGKEKDQYIIEVTILFAKQMGIKQRWLHGGCYYNQSGLYYREEVEMVGERLYELIEEYYDSLEDNRIIFILYNHGYINKEYNDFINELNKRTGFYFDSDLNNVLRSLEFHANREYYKYKQRSNEKPTIIFSKEETLFTTNIDDDRFIKDRISKKDYQPKQKQYK